MVWSSEPVTILLPAFNEEQAIEAELQRIKTELVKAGIEHELLVVDDGSSDGTARMLETLSQQTPELVEIGRAHV